MNKKILEEVVEFVKQPDIKSAFETADFDYIYDMANSRSEFFNSLVTLFCLEANINPLKYIDNVPVNYCNLNTHFSDPDDPYKKYLENLIIPDNIKAIHKNAFHDCKQIRTLTISEGVETIGDSAFYMCVRLKKLYLPSTLKRIGNYAFYAIPTTLLAIEYNGTVEQFKQIQKAPFWWDGFNNITVSCTDGEYVE